MLISKNKIENINLKINNQIIERVQHTSYLGTIIHICWPLTSETVLTQHYKKNKNFALNLSNRSVKFCTVHCFKFSMRSIYIKRTILLALLCSVKIHNFQLIIILDIQFLRTLVYLSLILYYGINIIYALNSTCSFVVV